MKFNIDLSGYNTDEYNKNPVVLWEFDYVNPPIGRAIIADDKKSVEVELTNFADKLFSLDFTKEYFEIAESYSNHRDMEHNSFTPTLTVLAIVPKGLWRGNREQ